jgi:dihydrofolate reductase
MDRKRGIGKNNKIPWHIKEDLIKLKNLTKDHVVILGRKTYDSMVWYYNKSGKEMPGKLYIVITRDKSYKPTRYNAEVADSLEGALKIAKEKHLRGARSCHLGGGEARYRLASGEAWTSTPPRWSLGREKEVFIIGGGQIFQQALRLANKLYLTIVRGDFNCDTFFPDYSEFKKVIHEESNEGEGYKYKFIELVK